MSNSIFSPLEIDALGEISNISLGSSATAISNLLDHRVDITTPSVSVVNAEDFELGSIEPAIGVEIKYVTGLEGSNIMLLKMSDIKVIVDILMGTETPDEEFELNELSLSAACEVMNQMMGAASTALSDFLGRVVNISTPQTFDLDDLEAFKQERLPVQEGPVVVVRFALDIEPSLKSEFMNVMSVDLARELLNGFNLGYDKSAAAAAPAAPAPAPAPMPEPEPEPEVHDSNRTLSQEEIEKMLAGGIPSAPPAPEPEPEPEAHDSNRTLSQEEIEKMLAGGIPPAPPAPPEPAPAAAPTPAPAAPAPAAAQPVAATTAAAPAAAPGLMSPEQMAQMMQMMQMMMPMYQMQQPPQQAAPVAAAPDPKVINTQQPAMPHLAGADQLGEEQAQNLDLIMGVPLEVTVEIGRTRKKVQDILSFAKGSLVILDKLAGDQVDLFVNGKCIARGEVVVIDDNFGIRIGEIVRKPELEDFTSGK